MAAMSSLRRRIRAIEDRLPKRLVTVDASKLTADDPEVIAAEALEAEALDAWHSEADRFGRRPEDVRRALLNAVRRASEARNGALDRLLPSLERPDCELVVIRRRHHAIDQAGEAED